MDITDLVDIVKWLKDELNDEIKTTRKLIIFLGIMENIGIDMQTLQKKLELTQTTFSKYVKHLEKKNLIVKYPSPEDGRISLLGLTMKSKKLKEDLAERLKQY